MQISQRFLVWGFLGLLAIIQPASAVPTTLDFSAYPPGTDVSTITIPGVTFIPGTGTVTVLSPNELRIAGASGSAVDFEIRTDTVMQSSSFVARGTGSCQLIDRFDWNLSGAQVDTYQNVLGGAGRCLENVLFERSFAHDSITFSIDITNSGFGGTVVLQDVVLDLPATTAPTPVPVLPPLGLLLLAALVALSAYARMARRAR